MQKLHAGRLLAALALAAQPGAQGDWEEARAALFERTVPAVEELARACQGWRLYAERDRLYEALIRLEPDHRLARRGLRYRRKQGVWVQGERRPSRNFPSAHEGELAERRAALAGVWKREIQTLAERFDPAGERRDELLDLLLVLAPDDPEARAARGEVRTASGDWVLAETQRALVQRAFLESRAREIRGRVTHFEGAPSQGEAAGSPIRWKQTLAARHARLLATREGGRARELLRAVENAGLVFELAFGEVPSLPHDFTLYVVDRSQDRRAFLQRHPRADEGLRRSAAKAGAIWFDDGSAMAFLDAPGRACVEQTLCESMRCFLGRSFGLTPRAAWALEGFRLRLCELAAGEADAEQALDSTLWRRAVALAREGALPPLATVLAPREERLDAHETVLAYAFARYLLEGHPREAARLLADLGHGMQPIERCLADVLGTDVARLEPRLQRWILQMDGAARDRP